MRLISDQIKKIDFLPIKKKMNYNSVLSSQIKAATSAPPCPYRSHDAAARPSYMAALDMSAAHITSNPAMPKVTATFCSPTPGVAVCYTMTGNLKTDTVSLTTMLPVVNGQITIPASHMTDNIQAMERAGFH